MKKINVSPELCIGCGACIAIDAEHFAFNDQGLSEVIKNDDLESTALKEGMESCPTDAISFKEDCTCECGENCECDPCECNDSKM